jgi:hypothetical protein
MPHNDTRPVSGPAEHRDEWVTYCSHIDQHGEQFCDCAPPLAEIVAEVERLREALRPFVDAYDAVGRTFCPEFRGREALDHFDRAAAALERS